MLEQFRRIAARHAVAFLPVLESAEAMLRDFRVGRAVAAYRRDWRAYAEAYAAMGGPAGPAGPFRLDPAEAKPVPYSRYRTEAGKIPRHYFHQDLWAARKVHASGTEVHYDMGSRLDGFIAHCLAFCRVVMIDIRPLSLAVDDLGFVQADARDLSAIPSGSVRSLSSLHAVEHIGLGRYGDPVDPAGHLKAVAELERILAPGGELYFSTPVGRQRLVFNKHRIFDPLAVPRLFGGCDLAEFSVEEEGRRFTRNADPSRYRDAELCCGMYHFRKR
jgi:SAM-dependent methyltransferase